MSLVLSGKQISKVLTPSHRSRNPYKTKAYHSEVDETLFGSPSRYCQQKETPRVLPEEVTWDPPWVTSPTKTGAPLLWTPFDSKGSRQGDNSGCTTPRHENKTPRTPTSARNKYRPRKQTPSYVDETLFGPPIKEPSFEAPWNVNNDSHDHCPVTWSPPLPDSLQVNVKEQRKKPKNENQKSQPSSRRTPVIKPRYGSAINTPQSKIALRYHNGDMVDCDIDSKVQQKLNFERNNDDAGSEKSDDPDAIVDRALKLAGIYSRTRENRHRSNSLSSLTNGAVSPGGYFWRRPTSAASSTGSPKERAYTPRQTSSSNINRDLDDLFSATGKKLQLTPRGTSRGKPNTARSEVSMGSVPGLDLSKPPRMYGHQRPSSARSARSHISRQSPRTETPLSSRPSWRP